MAAFRAWRADPSRCLPVARDIARSHGLPHADAQLFAAGTNLVVALDDRLVLKVFPPPMRHQFVSERLTLSLLFGRLELPIPEIVAEGERDQWSYLVITRLQGVLGAEAWPVLSEDDKVRVLGPAPAPISRLKRIYRFHFVLKAERRDTLGRTLRALLAHADTIPIPRRSLLLDIDPVHLM